MRRIGGKVKKFIRYNNDKLIPIVAMSLVVIFLNEKPSMIVLLGEVILVLTTLIQEAEEIIKIDPFYIHDVAEYDFIWFEPSKSLEEIKELVERKK